MVISISNVRQKGSGFLDTIRANPITTVGAVAGTTALIGGGLVIASKARKSTRKRKTTRKRTKKTKLTARQRKVRRIKKRPGRQSPYTAGARKDRSRRRIRYTKNGQPYVLTARGKAKFIKKSSAKRSRKRKGGRY